MFSKNVFVNFEHLECVSIPSLIFMFLVCFFFFLSQYIAVIALVPLPLLQVRGFAHKLTIIGRLS